MFGYNEFFEMRKIMKNKVLIMTLMCAMSVSLAACGTKSEPKSEDKAEVTSEAVSETSEVSVTETSETATTETEVLEVSTETATETKEAGASSATGAALNESESAALFEELSKYEYCFSSGAGAWSTYVYIGDDGSFEGYYHDSDMGDIGDDYPYGTSYYCSFKGKFSNPVKVNDYTYSLKIESMTTENEAGTEEITDGVKVVYSDPYGFENTDEIIVYTAETPVSAVSEEYLSWVRMAMDENATTIGFTSLYNPNGEYGFTSYNTDDPYDLAGVVCATYESVDAELAAIEEKSAVFDSILSGDLSQTEYNEYTYWQYTLWDKELNSIWSRLKNKMAEGDFAKLTEEQRTWISDKEAAIADAGKEYEGGTIQPMAENMKGTELTKERVYKLAEYLK